MLTITSISPTHKNKDIQAKCIQSWIELGMEVCSVNSPDETKELKELYPNVQFYSTDRTLEKTFGKPYVQISAIIDICKTLKGDEFCIINSDIELITDKDTIERISKEMVNSLVMANRVNHNGNYTGTQYLAGIDVFFIHKRFLPHFPQCLHGLGMTFVDYFIPYSAIKSGISTVFIEQSIAYHLNHEQQWSRDNWVKSGRHLQWQYDLYQFEGVQNINTRIGRMSTFVHTFIYNASQKKKI